MAGKVTVIKPAKFVAKPPTDTTFDLPDAANDPTTEGRVCSDSSTNALAINFSNGFSTCASTATLFAVRAVRGGR